MKCSVWARKKGITYNTAWWMHKRRRIPHPSEQLPTGTLFVYPDRKNLPLKVAIYARVSSYSQKADLKKQSQRLRAKRAMQVIQQC
ncbi:MAG: hypothetical protein ACW99F_05475 [Candidatus Hodarchaeales archaeon]